MSGNGPQSLALAEHLRLCTVAELTDYLRFWGPHEKRRNGRTDLIERLQRLMTDENVVYAKVDLLSEKVRTVLLGLLRKTHYTSDLQGLFRGIDGLEMEYYEAEAALNALAKRGFVRTSRDQDWLHYGRSAYAIPVEIALVMRGLAGADTRPFPRIFLHAEYTPSSVEAAANEPIPDPPESVAAAVETLPNAVLRLIAKETIEGYGGIVTRHEFADVFGARGVRWRSARFLREFGARGLGTVGHLDLRDKGIGLEDDALVFFAEVVERHVADLRTRAPEHDVVLSAHGDLMSDVCTLLGLLKEFPVRLAKDGSVYKASRARIAEELQFALQPLVERKEVAERALALVRDLGLAAEADGGQLAMTEAGDAWRRAPLLAKVEQAYGRLLLVERPTLRSQHLRQLQPILVDLLLTDGGTSWWPGLTLAMLARNRYLLRLA